ncbi:aminoglycoside phosphotransferase family protein [Geomonas oryzisoli]|uniref:Aminoglycoside phosphotransferase family protein n=1 Tax=Geomonas oryzisoli TaxID=2847992 RepID=A0ABX8J8J4_9BACT|nr:phosphotransferase [Geomonas oryzisoli]QWV91845.1 aminoglycoside phosphotransferase family protein [Geomonas oryzisoli]
MSCAEATVRGGATPEAAAASETRRDTEGAAGGVLVIGERLGHLRELHAGAVPADSLPSDPSELEPFSTILLHSSALRSSRELPALLEGRAGGAANRVVVIVAENPLLSRGRGEDPCPLTFAERWQLFRGRLERLCPEAVPLSRRFLAAAGGEGLQELVAADFSGRPTRYDAFPAASLTRKGVLARFLARRAVVVVLPSASWGRMLIGDVVDMVSAHVGGSSACFVERVDVRSRGAVVLFLAEQGTGRRFVARLVFDAASDAIIARNAQYLGYLRSLGDAALQRLIPTPLGRRTRPGVTVYLETKLPGELAWKRLTPWIRRRTDRDMELFLTRLAEASGHRVLLDQATLDALFREDMEVIRACPAIDQSFFDSLCTTVSGIKKALLGRSLELVSSHGDFGYGNVLVHPVTGTVRGVIDWDTGRKSEFPAVDLVNHYIQKERIRRGCNFFAAFEAVLALPLAGLPLAAFYLGCGQGALLHYVTFLRYLARSARYHKLFQAHCGEYVAAHQMLLAREPL